MILWQELNTLSGAASHQTSYWHLQQKLRVAKPLLKAITTRIANKGSPIATTAKKKLFVGGRFYVDMEELRKGAIPPISQSPLRWRKKVFVKSGSSVYTNFVSCIYCNCNNKESEQMDKKTWYTRS